jgi:hypothetical protein
MPTLTQLNRQTGQPVRHLIVTATPQSGLTEGEYFPGSADQTGAQRVVVTGGGGGGTAAVDESAFTAGVSSGTPIMGVITPSDSPPSGDLAVVALDANRNLKVSGSFSTTPATSNTATSPSQTTLGTTAATALAANAARKGFSIQNGGLTRIKVLLGAATPTQSNYTVSLPAGGSTNDGSSPVYNGPANLIWTGAVQWISDAPGGLATAVEYT